MTQPKDQDSEAVKRLAEDCVMRRSEAAFSKERLSIPWMEESEEIYIEGFDAGRASRDGEVEALRRLVHLVIDGINKFTVCSDCDDRNSSSLDEIITQLEPLMEQLNGK